MSATTLTPQQRDAIAIIVDATLHGIKAAEPREAPTGPIYAAMMHHGASFNQYNSLMGALHRAGLIVWDTENDTARLTPKGRARIAG